MDPLRVLIVEDNPAYARLVQETLSDSGGFDTHVASRLDEAIRRLAGDGIDVVLLDLGLPDARGTDGFRRLGEEFPGLPVVVLTGFDDEQMAMDIVREGAQDYLVKGRAENEALARALRYAVERNRMQNQLRQQALVDELTGLHNRRGFATLASHQLKVAKRQTTPLVVLFVDLDGMKSINDTYGHAEGDRALIDTADLLRSSLRSSDVVARLGGDEFCALLTDCEPSTAAMVIERVQGAVASHNDRGNRPYTLSLSIGLAAYDPERDRDIDELIEPADRSMSGRRPAEPARPDSVADRPHHGRDHRPRDPANLRPSLPAWSSAPDPSSQALAVRPSDQVVDPSLRHHPVHHRSPSSLLLCGTP